MKLDILALAAHPDDVEISCSGTLLYHLNQGYKVGVLDLTRGEKGTRGSAEIRDKESAEAAKILNLNFRHNLELADCFFQNDVDSQLKIIRQIRKLRPEVVLCNAPEDRHPDHGKGASLEIDSCFYAGLSKIETEWEGVKQEAWRPKNVFHYIQDRFLVPDLVFDVTPFWDTKIKALKAFKSQFYNPESDEPQTYISTEGFWKFLEARGREMGHYISTPYGEGFIKTKMIKGNNLLVL